MGKEETHGCESNLEEDTTLPGGNPCGRSDDDRHRYVSIGGKKSEESCGASNPKIDAPAGPPINKGNKGKEFEDCGFRNNPNYGPPGQEE